MCVLYDNLYEMHPKMIKGNQHLQPPFNSIILKNELMESQKTRHRMSDIPKSKHARMET